LLIIPFPESSLNEEAGKQFMENYEEYFKHAKMMTQTYAMSNNKENFTFV
jgi:ubiquitin-conjugating enzyme E2 S